MEGTSKLKTKRMIMFWSTGEEETGPLWRYMLCLLWYFPNPSGR